MLWKILLPSALDVQSFVKFKWVQRHFTWRKNCCSCESWLLILWIVCGPHKGMCLVLYDNLSLRFVVFCCVVRVLDVAATQQSASTMCHRTWCMCLNICCTTWSPMDLQATLFCRMHCHGQVTTLRRVLHQLVLLLTCYLLFRTSWMLEAELYYR